MANHPTKSFEKPTVEDRFRILPSGISAVEVVDLARSAGLAFMAGTALVWSREELRRWLLLEYETATAWTRSDEAPIDFTTGLDDVEVSLLLDRTRARVMAMLERAHDLWKVPTFARDMIDGRLVVAVYDRDGSQAYAPTSHADMGLVHRVTSLFVADYLARPSDYALVSSCEACGQVAIGSRSSHPSWCAEPPTKSGIVERTDDRRSYGKRPTLRGVG